MMDQVLRVDVSKVRPEVWDGLANGTMRYSESNGLVYWAKGSGNTGVVQQLPLIPADLTGQVDSLSESIKAIQAAQSLQLAATALSTGLILGALVLQTAYLSRKLDAIQRSIDGITATLKHQAILFYMEKISDYFGAVEAARVFMSERAPREEVQDVAVVVLADLAIRRNQMFSFLDNLQSLADHAEGENAPLLLDFMIAALDLLPKGIFIEKELYAYLGKYGLADLILDQSGREYGRLLTGFRTWANSNARAMVIGRGRIPPEVLISRDSSLKQLFAADENKMLLPGLAPKLADA